jgi:DNA modification methylase
LRNKAADLIDSQSPRKALDDWEQSPVEAEHVISKLTVQDDVVFDPLMGAAITGIAALRSKRRFVGIETDKDTFVMAKAMIDRELSHLGPN